MVSFQAKNPNLGTFWRENVDIFYGRLEYFTVIGDIVGPFATFCDNLVHVFRFWYIVSRKIWQPW
jgi:hypothetical protein